MSDPTKAMRKMYYQGLSSVIRVYDGWAPLSATSPYCVITTNFEDNPKLKVCESYSFTATLQIYHEFQEYGNSETLDNVATQILDVIIPEAGRPSYLSIEGWNHDEVKLVSGANQTFQNAKLVIYQKTLVINHFISKI